MASSVLEKIKEEVTCSICLELLKEPVTAECNHSFCQACITLTYESSRNTEGEDKCPVCQVPYTFGNLRPNQHVANIVESLKKYKSIPEEQQKVNICAQHGEKLQLFCRKDMMAICWLCERSQEHRGHQTALIEEVGHEYKEKLQEDVQRLIKIEKIYDKWQDDLQQQRADWENQIQSNVENVQIEINKLRDFLDFKENEELQKLKKEKEDVLKKLEESQNVLERQRELVRDLITDKKHHLELSTMEMLQGVNCILTRRLMDIQQYWVHVTLCENNQESIWMKNRSVYNAFDECSVTHNSSVLALSLPGPPSRIGVFLDREACTLSFYDVSNCGALIYRFFDPSLPHEVYPYFNPMECSEPMTICGPPS
ncbi:Tripartite motif-containing protein 30A [Apodemus speciosus]|uniref:Tripartite motif-containing protein 30A n=1 Tax=Apodemus speciosus TaxID=105296 RepID=A0ABQ0F074_APOSI